MDQGEAGGVSSEEARVAGSPSLKRRLLSGGAWASMGRVGTAFTALATNALLARLLSPQELGAYFLAFSMISVGSLVGLLGLDHVIVRFLAESMGLDQPGRARRVLGRILVLGVSGALAMSAAYLLLGGFIGNRVFDSPALAASAGLVAGWMAAMSLQLLVAQAFRGFHDIRLASIFNNLTAGVLLTAFLGAIWLLEAQATLATALLLGLISSLASTTLAGWLLRRKAASLSSRGSEKDEIGFGGIMRVAWPLLVTNLTLFAFTHQTDLWIIGAFRSQEEVAVYGAAVRAIFVVTTPVLIVNSVVSPLIAEMYAQGRRRELERALRSAATLAGIPAFLILSVFVVFGGPILGLLFGGYYREGATILVVLSVAQVINALTAASGTVLMMTGHQTVLMALTVVGGLLTVAMGLLVVVPFGATGVAVAAAAGIALYNISLWLLAKRATGMWTHAGLSGVSDLIRTARRIGR